LVRSDRRADGLEQRRHRGDESGFLHDAMLGDDDAVLIDDGVEAVAAEFHFPAVAQVKGFKMGRWCLWHVGHRDGENEIKRLRDRRQGWSSPPAGRV